MMRPSLLFPSAAACHWIGPGNAFTFVFSMTALHFGFFWKVDLEARRISLERIQQQLGIA